MLVIHRTQLDFKMSFVHLISILCLFDTICILLNVLIFSGPLLNETYRHQVSNSFKKSKISNILFPQVFPHLVPLVLPLAQISLTCSVYTILALTVERFLAVKW